MKYTKVVIFWIAILFLNIVFESQINAFIDKYIMALNYANIWAKVLYVIIMFFAAIELARNIKIIHASILIHCLFISLLYFLYRQNLIEHPNWKYEILFDDIKYADVIFIPLIISIVKYVKKWMKNIYNKFLSNNSASELISNNPIQSKNEDKLSYAKDAENLLNMLIKNKKRTSDGALIIGLRGKWGQGKTSYFNLMREAALSRKDVILLRLNVWQCSKYQTSVKSLLKIIADGINDISLKNTINEYAKVIIDADISYLSKILSIFYRSKSPEELFQSISKQIKELDKTLIIQIDDLDRLTSEEVFDIIKLIRVIANFNNIFFIVAYDEEYINNCLKMLHIDSSYLEKVFHIIYPLPVVSRNEQLETIKKGLVNSLVLLDVNAEKIITDFMTRIGNNITLRNAKRLSNTIQCGLTDLKDEDGIKLDLYDYILINYLQMINSNAYSFLANLADTGLYAYNDKCLKWNMNSYSLNMDKDILDLIKNNNEQLSEEEYIEQRLKKDVGDENIELTYIIFRELFDQERNGVARICYINSYQLYFNRTFDKKLVEKSTFKSSFNNGLDDFKTNLNKWNKEDFDQHNLMRLIENFQCETEEKWEQFFTALLEITPKSRVWTSQQYRRNEKRILIPIPGWDLLKSNQSVSSDKKQTLGNALYHYFYEKEILENDSLEILKKKLTLVLSSDMEYTNLMKLFNIAQISYKDIFNLYWNPYIQKGGSYKDFDEDFWYIVDKVYFSDRLELCEIAKKHIKLNIDEFIANYPIESILYSHLYLQELFINYNELGQSNGEWIPNFKQFLINIENKSQALNTYIQNLEKHLSNPKQ
ncbi:MAG: P-loop NTPase fold protein [Parabacteroides sp.]|uniref:KAP family NTPase n=1 Tax=Parabacteroides faecalis TaxID=2924040 RepID=A0ABT0BZM3_9BACT|nr:P-loop NTPase fold protein [Parabacteroides faecalis]MCI7287795.1 KAP family NTPase [Parabacteroides sp.]MCJ2380218.1 KAP family NTPase [Parabacteroides faecalis]MDD7561479.1 P-loop NTPase fold protein [Parabacteroides sp.]MDY6255854.1 P-loop NTPase fold protein [Bacteroidales bacterium]